MLFQWVLMSMQRDAIASVMLQHTHFLHHLIMFFDISFKEWINIIDGLTVSILIVLSSNVLYFFVIMKSEFSKNLLWMFVADKGVFFWGYEVCAASY